MSDSLGDAMPECEPSSRSSLSESSNGPQQQPVASTGKVDSKHAASAEKTISCVSCRKRKLKCDRIKPSCGTCSRLKHQCEYPERRRNVGAKRRNMKELEARLAQVETQLVAETTQGTATSHVKAFQSTEPDWNDFTMDMNMDIGGEMLDNSFNIPLSAFDTQPLPGALPEGNMFSQELIGLGLSEPLPPQQMIDDLHEIYFEKYHPTMPMIHKYRYLSALNLPSHMQPPVCLRYALWATAASVSEVYLQYEDVLYERARKYIQEEEMKSHGETFVSIQFAQAWGLIATYEAKKTYFTRAWMSTGRMTRLTQMLGLHRLDGDGQEIKRILGPAKDWTELEERRRVFWAAFYGDRWASSGTGWPMLIVEEEIQTNLPSSEEAFYSNTPETTTPLAQALTPEGASKISPFGGVVLSACLFGHNFQHLHKTGPNERPEDLAEGEFWKRHRQMDNVLANTFMFLPEHLRLPTGLRDLNVVFLHMNIHTSVICLHQAAVLIAEKNNLPQSFIHQSRSRSLMAAEEIANTMRLVSHLDASNMNSWMGFCLYVAAGVFIQDSRSNDSHSQSIMGLEFLLAAMKAIGNRHSITHHFTAQLEVDIESSGIRMPGQRPNIPMNGIIASRAGVPTTVEDIRSYTSQPPYNQDFQSRTYSTCSFDSVSPNQTQETLRAENPASGRLNHPTAPHFFGVIPRDLAEKDDTKTWEPGGLGYGLKPRTAAEIEIIRHLPPEGLRAKHVHPSYPNWDPPANSALSNLHQEREAQLHNHSQSSIGAAALPGSAAPTQPYGETSSFDIDTFLAGNTPSSDSSGSNVMQVPYRQADSSRPSPGYSAFEADPGTLNAASGWDTSIDLSANSFDLPGNDPDTRPSNVIDSARQFYGIANWGKSRSPSGS